MIFTGGKSINKICLLQKLMSCSKRISSILSKSSIFNEEKILIFIDKSFRMLEMGELCAQLSAISSRKK